MRILVTGAYGFIGSYLVSALLRQGYEIICAVRDTERAKNKFPSCPIIACDFNQDTDPETWIPRLQNIDVVINLVGILNSTRHNDIHLLHTKTPQALFKACVKAHVKKIIHFSAAGVEDKTATAYAKTKHETDEFLSSLNDIDWIILQPSFIYAAQAYGGTAMLKALAATPGCIPLVGDGMQITQPIHMDDIVNAVCYFVNKTESTRKKFALVGPEQVTLRDVLKHFRQWLGLKPALFIPIPKLLMKWFARIGDFFPNAPLNTTGFIMLEHAKALDPEPWQKETGIQALSFVRGLETTPTTVQSLWAARLINLKPLIRITLGLVWLTVGINLLMEPLFDNAIVNSVFGIFSALSGAALLIRKKVFAAGMTQAILLLISIFLTALEMQATWIEVVFSILQQVSVLLLVLAMLAIEPDK